MKELYDDLHLTCEILSEELADLIGKVDETGRMSMADLDEIDKLTHAIKSVKTTMAMMDAEGKVRTRRESMERHVTTSAHEKLLAELHEMMPNAPDDQTKQEISQLINRLEKR
jgi:hypothetical protein